MRSARQPSAKLYKEYGSENSTNNNDFVMKREIMSFKKPVQHKERQSAQTIEYHGSEMYSENIKQADNEINPPG